MKEDLMVLEKLEHLYLSNNLGTKEFQFAKALIIEFWNFMGLKHKVPSVSEMTTDDINDFIAFLYSEKRSSLDEFIVLMRYMRILKKNDCFIELTKYTGILDVVDNILLKLKQLHGQEILELVTKDLDIPSLGMSPKQIPLFTAEFMRRLHAALPEEEVKKVLAGNNHGMSKEAMLPEKVEYENSNSFEEYLEGLHRRKVEELIKYKEAGKVWFEQAITDEVIDFVSKNPEVLSGVIRDDYLYITKIPYDTEKYLSATTDKEMHYYACHCAFAREAVLQESHDISPIWCYCSGGFAKFPFEVILDQKLKVESLENVLEGGKLCRFRIPLKGISYKMKA